MRPSQIHPLLLLTLAHEGLFPYMAHNSESEFMFSKNLSLGIL